MIPLRLSEVAALTGGRLTDAPPADHAASVVGTGPEVGAAGVGGAAEDIVVDGLVTTDSRECGPGSLYVARVGAAADGHDFVPAAADRGAVAALTSRPVAGLPCVVVDDVEVAFGRLARGVLDRAGELPVIGVTGSSGKTSTKDLLAAVLATAGETVAPVNSLNGEIGVPLTVCRVTPSTRYLVVEMGARGRGHITYLTGIAPPTVGIVLNVGSAHVGEFGSRENIALAKAELPLALPPEGLAVLNADDPAVAAMRHRVASRVVLVGSAPEAQVRSDAVELDELGRPTFTLTTPQGRARVSLGLTGAHHVGNALAVTAAALDVGLTLEEVVAGLEGARPASRWRMEVTQRPDGVVVVNDAYNANPDSMRAALDALAAMRAAGRRWAVVGEMLELGSDSAAEHAAVGRYAASLGIDHVVAVGEGARAVGAGRWAPDADAAYELLARELRDGDVVLLKSSRDSGLRFLGERLAAADAPGPAGTPGPADAPGPAGAPTVTS
ncbi:MAG TPA: UDP-N-acetylmuramoyl-tripeptide--D-alanyl-D-alanine ligase [Intrasporangium sp.]|uniref:UDP-N-acetylmuramoyl-tripeptide--D-alanyl-D- alanine ligase n=1 Tax=Intrasporangium sp. TaxID=1925024 RepID=UPI002D7A2BCA|nr:UDP-N-acetylmuramoyl-tripeptide--D-alanyl-D-alanine ligase [Intrasporangium sp.]HET7398530.1 UDP-N-acetylmuramoyl-tripeptide--D-alanyl-D-alanine ligase [Intrasporangium sp.]